MATDDQDADEQDDRVLLEDLVLGQMRHGAPPYSAASAAADATAQATRLGLGRRDRLPDVAGHDQRAGEEQQAAQRADHVEGMHRLDGLDEGVFEEAVAV